VTRVRDIADVVEQRLCTGCGACVYVDPGLVMVDDLDVGRRPLGRSRQGLAVCPGIGLEHDAQADDLISELTAGWGPVRAVYEGYAADPEIRFLASSGGAATALSLFALECAGMYGVLHIRARRDVPWLNETVLSRSRSELVEATGSRYAPASPCDGLDRIEAAPAPCVFIGKPCDAAAAHRAARLNPKLDEKLGLSIAIFCAGTPSTSATLDLIRELGIADPRSVESVRYRGRGWPGRFRARLGDREVDESYARSWHVLQSRRQWRCYVCADHTGEFADVAVGDPWYREIPADEPGRSLVLARSERGHAFVQRAVSEGYLVLEPANPAILAASQPELLKTRGAIWGRIWSTRLLGVAAPRYRGMPMLRFWWRELSAWEKLQSVLGTAIRVFRKRLRHRLKLIPFHTDAPGSPEDAEGRGQHP
jgi:coenzyme F420 hydrogenase subunit beta